MSRYVLDHHGQEVIYEDGKWLCRVDLTQRRFELETHVFEDDTGLEYFPDRDAALVEAVARKLGAKIISRPPSMKFEPGRIY